MALQIKIVDTEFNEHEYFVSDYSGIQVSDNNDGRFVDIDDSYDFLDHNGLDHIKDAIDRMDYTPADLGYDISDYIERDDFYEDCSLVEHFDDVEDNGYEVENLIKHLVSKGLVKPL
jgi:hypothetical protein